MAFQRYLERRAPGQKLGAIGFCFGGGMAWLLLASGEPRLAASAPFYGPLPEGADFSGSPNAAVLGIYAERDDGVNASRDGATGALERAGLTHEIVTYPAPTTPSSTTPVPATTRPRPPRPTPRSSTGSASTSADGGRRARQPRWTVADGPVPGRPGGWAVTCDSDSPSVTGLAPSEQGLRCRPDPARPGHGPGRPVQKSFTPDASPLAQLSASPNRPLLSVGGRQGPMLRAQGGPDEASAVASWCGGGSGQWVGWTPL
jgi:hypothetical protein